MRNTPCHEEIYNGNGWGMALGVHESWGGGPKAVEGILVTGIYKEVFSHHIQQQGEMLKRNSKGKVKLQNG